jgi:hypothetical protein
MYMGDIFNTRGRLPAEWVDKVRKSFISTAVGGHVKYAVAFVGLVLQILPEDESDLECRVCCFPDEGQ